MPLPAFDARTRSLPVILTAIVACWYAAWAAGAGVRMSPDSETYSRWADLLIALRFDFHAYLNNQQFVVPPFLYLLWVTLVAVLKTLLGPSWGTGVVVLNWIAAVGGVYLVLGTIRRLTGSVPAVAFGAAMLMAAGDVLIFLPFALSDLIYWSLSITVLVMALALSSRATTAGEQRPWPRLALAGSAVLLVAFAFRPTAVPLVVLWALALGLAWGGRKASSHLGLISLTVVAGAIAAVMVHAFFLAYPERWPWPPVPGIMNMLAGEYRQGILVYAPGETNLYVAIPEGVAGYARLTFQKWLYFFTPWMPHFSASHTLINAAFFAPVYALSAASLVRAWRNRSGELRAEVTLLWLYVLAVSVFHALMQIEYDHRYRLPVLPALVLLASCELAALMRQQPRSAASTGPGR